jgi:hypothetical protein
MGAFKTPVDVGNRALQHCGAGRMDPVAGFNEDSRNASEVGFAYDKQREVELSRRWWTFAIKTVVLRAVDTSTMRLAPALWSQVATYFFGSIVSDQAGNFWISDIPSNLNNDPLLTTYWKPYAGPLSVSLYDSATAYCTGELVYTTSGNGLALIYLSLQSGNSDAPGTATPYDATVTYSKNQVVTFASVAYMSLINFNLNNEPDLAPPLFNIATTYAAAARVGGSDGLIYQSIGSGNVGNDPTLDAGVNWTNTGVLNPWTSVFVGGTGSDKWLLIGGSGFPAGVGLTTLNIVYPVGAGPSWQSTSRNVYLKPASYLRLAPQNPKPGLNPLGGPSGVGYDDRLLQDDYIVTSDAGPITLRFVADFTDVGRMHANFCEAVAARIAMAICDTITQSNAQLQIVQGEFKKWESDALTIDGIESGFEDPPDDDFVTVRN